MTRDIPRIMIAGPSSGVGKTTLTAGLIASLRKRGLVVQPFKCGPDYIDPSYHERAAGRACRNLDSWMLSDAQLLEGFSRACKDADIAVIEGVMGLFDGSGWHDERGSTAQLAKLLGAPVLLVIDIAGAASSASIAVLGCQQFDSSLPLRMVAFNFAGSESHARGCAEAVTAKAGVPVVGWLPRHDRLRVPERHLGLVPGGEQPGIDALIAGISAEVDQHFDIEALMQIARNAGPLGVPIVAPLAATADAPLGETAAAPLGATSAAPLGATPASPPGAIADAAPGETAAAPFTPTANQPPPTHRPGPRPVLAVARDEAFCFYYPENLELLEEAGAAIEFFSPMRGERPSENANGVYLGGGYPELHGPALAANTTLWTALRQLHSRNAPIFAECGGFMALTEGITDRDGNFWPMAALIPGVARMTDRLAALGYRHAKALRSNLLSEAGESLRGHEFRYSSWACDAPLPNDITAWELRGTRANSPVERTGYVYGNLLASYLHIHFGQHPQIAQRFVRALATRNHA